MTQINADPAGTRHHLRVGGLLLSLAVSLGAAQAADTSGASVRAEESMTPPAAESGLAALEATRAKPLFSPTRRPPPVAAVEVPAGTPPPPPAVEPPLAPPDLQLSGVVIGTQQVAIVKHPQDQAAIHVTLGTPIDGWVVSAIGPREIVLSHDTRRVTIQFPAHDH